MICPKCAEKGIESRMIARNTRDIIVKAVHYPSGEIRPTKTDKVRRTRICEACSYRKITIER